MKHNQTFPLFLLSAMIGLLCATVAVSANKVADKLEHVELAQYVTASAVSLGVRFDIAGVCREGSPGRKYSRRSVEVSGLQCPICVYTVDKDDIGYMKMIP